MREKGKDAFLLTSNFHYYITTLQGRYRVSERLVTFKMVITLELKALSVKFKQGNKRQKEDYQGTYSTLSFTLPVDLFLIPCF